MRYLLGLITLPATLVAMWAGYSAAQLLGGPDGSLLIVALLYALVAVGAVTCVAVCVAGYEIVTQVELSRQAAESRHQANWKARYGAHGDASQEGPRT